VVAQVLFAALPVVSSRLFLALFPTLFAQALELGLLAALIGRLPFQSARSIAIVAGLAAATQLSYTGSVVDVAAVLATLAVVLWRGGERVDARRILFIALTTTTAVGLLLYARFVPVFWTQVLPHAAAGGSDDPGVIARTIGRLLHFFGVAYPALVVIGGRGVARMNTSGRNVLLSALLAGIGLLMLRGIFPAVARDVKEIELLAAPVALLATVGLAGLTPRRGGRWLVAAIVGALVTWGGVLAMQAFLQNVVALER
jgi:hypothetical protein